MRACLALLAVSLASCATGAAPAADPGEDAALIYRGLTGRIPEIPAVIEAAFDDEKTNAPALQAALALYDTIFEELARATRARRCEWTYDRPPSISHDYPLDFVLKLVKPLVVRARCRLRSSDLSGALEDLKVLAKFGSDLSQDRWWMGHLLGCICQFWACDAIQAWIRSGPTDADALARMDDHLKLLARRFPTFEARLRLERNMALPLVDDFLDLGFDELVHRVAKDLSPKQESPPVVRMWEEWLKTTLPTDRGRLREAVSQRWDGQFAPFLEDARLPLNSRKTAELMADLKAKSDQMSGRMARNTLGGKAGEQAAIADLADILFILWTPAMDKAGNHHENILVALEMTALACRLEMQVLTSGTYPETLQDVGGAPRDPYDGSSFRYRRVATPKGEGYVLAVAGRRNDAEERMRVLSEECGFDKEKFLRKGYEFSDLTTFGTLRVR